MATESQSTSRISTLIAVLIAVISVVGALIAWRVAVASSKAGNADTDGLLAAVDREDAVSAAYTILYGHLTVYARSLRTDNLAQNLLAVASSSSDAAVKKQMDDERDGLIYAADTDRALVPQQYLNRNNEFDQERDIGETLANRALQHDTYPEPHFKIADDNRAQAEWLLLILVFLGLAFVLLTLADAIKNPLRYLLLLSGISIFLVGTLAALLIEIFGAPNIYITI